MPLISKDSLQIFPISFYGHEYFACIYVCVLVHAVACKPEEGIRLCVCVCVCTLAHAYAHIFQQIVVSHLLGAENQTIL